jgi:RNA polymerase sigma-70 factor (sigma-E family)
MRRPGVVDAIRTKTEATPVDPFAGLVAEHWAPLVRLAALLMRDSAHAEDVVQDALVNCLRGRPELRDPEAALGYLRRAVVNGARSRLRRRAVAWRHREPAPPDQPGADEGAIAGVERDAVIDALKGLPPRQREALVLRYYADATEKQAAAAMDVSVGAVKAYTSRGLAALARTLEEYR